MDMRFHVIRDHMLQDQFHIYWNKGKNNLDDYYTKQHPPWHQFKICPHVLNNPPMTKYYSSKGVLVVPSRGLCPGTPCTTTDITDNVISKSSVFQD